jgi:predicted pyridoxine 5'-phosphate oxidase superfamily flavin-nucleotide-binding protein
VGQHYHDAQRALQDRFDTRRLADRLAEATSTRISDEHRAFIEARDMFFLATADADGVPQCSYKGGVPGFVRVLDAETLTFPVYDGNGMHLSVGNILVNPHVGMLFVDLADGTRLRVNGVATVDRDPPVDAPPGAQLVVRVRVRAVFPNCRRYVHRCEPVERSVFVPSGDDDPPAPDWKRDPWFEGTLPRGDPAADPTHPSAPSVPRF